MGRQASHKRKDTLVAPPERWRHLKPFWKRWLGKAERRAAKQEIKAEIES